MRTAILPVLAVLSVACGSEDERIAPESSSLVLEGEATPEAFELMTIAEAKKWDWAAGVPETPEDGAVLSATSAATFTWSSDLIYEGTAAGAGLNGVAFWLKFSNLEGRVLDVFTTKREYTPSADAWSRLEATPGNVTLFTDSGVFEGDELLPDKGPFTGLSTTFSIE